jgi:hypothetical protein
MSDELTLYVGLDEADAGILAKESGLDIRALEARRGASEVVIVVGSLFGSGALVGGAAEAGRAGAAALGGVLVRLAQKRRDRRQPSEAEEHPPSKPFTIAVEFEDETRIPLLVVPADVDPTDPCQALASLVASRTVLDSDTWTWSTDEGSWRPI